MSPEQWELAGPVRRALLVASMTLGGRVLLGPIRSTCTFLRREAHGLGTHWRTWAAHVLAAGLVLWVVVALAGMPAWVYLTGFVYGGAALTLLRSFAEHRAVESGSRSAVVRSNPAMGLLFLNNNLHHAHHARPALAWYRLPGASREMGAATIAAAGAG